MKKLYFLIGLLLVSGCASHAGPFVTNISNDGDGNLTIEKCMTRFDPWMGVVNNSDCNNVKLKIK